MEPLIAKVGPWSAEWVGGPYAEIRHAEALAVVEALNLWDYETGGPRIPVEADALLAELRRWVDEVGADYAAELPYM